MSAAHITSRVLAQGASPSRNHVSNTQRFLVIILNSVSYSLLVTWLLHL